MTGDSFSFLGASKLRKTIEAYWLAKEPGMHVKVRLETLSSKYHDDETDRGGTIKGWVVRSDMIGGRPATVRVA